MTALRFQTGGRHQTSPAQTSKNKYKHIHTHARTHTHTHTHTNTRTKGTVFMFKWYANGKITSPSIHVVSNPII